MPRGQRKANRKPTKDTPLSEAGGKTKKPRKPRHRKHRHHKRECRTPEPYDSDSHYNYCGYYSGDYDDNLD